MHRLIMAISASLSLRAPIFHGGRGNLRVCLLACCFCAASFGVYAQEGLTFQQVESTSYRYYMEQKWDSVITQGKQALHQHIDYHYLRVRMGIAYYMEKKYRLAIPHLQQALKDNSANETAKEYLYLSLIYSGMYEAAGKLSYHFADSTAIIMQTKHHKLVDAVAIEGGKKFSSNDSLYQDPLFAGIVVNHRIGKAISFTHNLSYYQQTASWGKFWQGEYFVGCNIPIGNSWLLSPSQHFIYLSATPYIVELQSISSVALKKSFSCFDAYIIGSSAYIFAAVHTQETVGLNYFPFGNNKLMIGAALVANQDSLHTETELSFSASACWNVSKRLSLSAIYYNGDALFNNEYNGYLVNNSTDKTLSKIAFSPSFKLCKHVCLYGMVQYEQKIHGDEDSFQPTNIKFTYTTAFAGFKILL